MALKTVALIKERERVNKAFEEDRQIVRDNLEGTVEFAKALMRINERKLYRFQYADFDAFCKAECAFGKKKGYKLIGLVREPQESFSHPSSSSMVPNGNELLPFGEEIREPGDDYQAEWEATEWGKPVTKHCKSLMGQLIEILRMVECSKEQAAIPQNDLRGWYARVRHIAQGKKLKAPEPWPGYCPGCRGEVLWVKSPKFKNLPLEREPGTTGDHQLVDGVARKVEKPDNGELLWVNHFRRCPALPPKHQKKR